MQDRSYSPLDNPDEILLQGKQLELSLKFHHRETLQKIPLEAAIRVIAEVWESCHPEGSLEFCSDVSTVIITEEQVAASIRESKFFSG